MPFAPAGRAALLRAAALLRQGALLCLSLLLLQNIVLNVILLPLVNRRPERLQIKARAVWMLEPGVVHARALEVRGQGLNDQWLITADEGTARVSLPEMLDRRFRAGDVQLSGVSLRYRRRVDADASADPSGPRVVASNPPPIPGLQNPPDPNPETIYRTPAERWAVRLDDVKAEHVREIWMGDYRLTGEAEVHVNVSLSDPYIDLDGALSVEDMAAEIGQRGIASSIHGELKILVDSMDRGAPAWTRSQAISAAVAGSMDLQDLRFLDVYLAALPWLALSGVGHVDVNVALDQGMFRAGSALDAEFHELIVHYLDEDISGAGRLQARVDADAEGPRSRLAVDFDDFSITSGGQPGALAEGRGFHVAVESPDTAINQPFTEASVVVDLPESRIDDFSAYNLFLPADSGLALLRGTGRVQGHLEVSTLDRTASGTLVLSGDDVSVRFDHFTFTTDLSLHGRVDDAQLNEGVYQLGESTLTLRQGGLVNTDAAGPGDGARRWTSTAALSTGTIQVGAPIYLDSRVRIQCSDSGPFVMVFADRKTLPRWVQQGLSVRDLSGQARIQLGQDRMQVSAATIRGGAYQIDLRYLRREGLPGVGDLLVRAGHLTLGLGVGPDGRTVRLRGAPAWFEAQGAH